MSIQTVGTYGASIQSSRHVNPRDFLKDLLDANKGMGEIKLLKLVRKHLKNEDNQDDLDGVIDYWFVNNYRSLLSAPVKATITSAERKADSRAKVAAKAAVIMEKLTIRAHFILMDMKLPNGKKLGDCTGRELSQIGGAMIDIAGSIKPDEIVRNVLSESKLRKLYRG